MPCSIKQWFKDNENLIQGMTAIIQTVIAAFMLWTLIQSSQILSVTTRQLEATIDPVVTTYMFGNTLRLTNDGSIDVESITKTAIITGWFDVNLKKITEYQVARA